MSLFRAFLSSSLGTALSRLLGLGRELVFTHVLGAGMVSDAFVMAWTIPGMLRRFVADEGLTGALLPAVGHAESEDGVEAARVLAGRIMVALIVAGVLLCAVVMVATPWIVDYFATGFTGEKRALTIEMTRILLPFVVFVSLVSWCEGLLNHRQHFFVPKLAPGIVSLVMILGLLLPSSATPLEAGMALCWSVLVGGAAHLLFCLPTLYRHWGFIRPRLGMLRAPRSRRVLYEMLKVATIGIMAQINVLVLRDLASVLPDGSVSLYWTATRLVDFAQGIIAVGVGSALLPVIARAVIDNDNDAFRESFSGAVRLAAAMLLPVAAFVLVLATPTVAVLYRHGAFTYTDVVSVADALRMLVPFMLALAGIQIIKKPFFAMDRRNELIGVGAIGVALTWAIGRSLLPMGVSGLALALSLSTLGQLLLYVFLLARMVEGRLGLRALLAPLAKMAAATVPAALLGWGLGLLGDWEQGPTPANMAILAAAGAVGGVAYLASAHLLGLSEVTAITQRIRRKLGR